MKRRMCPLVIAAATRHLSNDDDRLAALIRHSGPCPLGLGRSDPFDILAWSIVSQQVSTKAASAIGRRVLGISGGTRMQAKRIHRLQQRQLRDAGLSNSKARYLLSLAAAVESRELNFRSLAQLDDATVTARLIRLPGIGLWTAQMFLMFALRRADIASPGDIGLRRGMQLLYDYDERPDETEFLRIAANWAPYRTVACWYLWRLVD